MGLGQHVIDVVQIGSRTPHHLPPVRRPGLLEIDEDLGMMGVAADVDVPEPDRHVVVKAEGRHVVAHQA